LCLLFNLSPLFWERAGVRENKKPFIHIRDEEFSPRYHPNYVFKLERSNVSTFEPANVTFVAITGFPVNDYLR
jgi:hypothetical protein